MRQIEPIEFNVKFITPLLIHGANSRVADSIGLTGKALRGCWRFWFRALVGGMIQSITKEKLIELESKVFGSSDEKVGAKFRLRIAINSLPDKKRFKLGFQRNDRERGWIDVETEGYPEKAEFAIAILPRKNMADDEFEVLLASIWLWGNLGAIGQRARRGFGSPVIEPHNHINHFERLKLPLKSLFSDSDEVREYLCNGLSMVWLIFEQWLKKMGSAVTGDIATNPVSNAKYFILGSLGQIAVGDKPFSDLTGSLRKVHGSHKCDGLGWAIKNGRMASPIFTRFHKVVKNDKESFLPVITWCPQKINSNDIPHHDCLNGYLKGGTCNCGYTFSNNLGFSAFLSGDTI